MCGITGFLDISGGPEAREALGRMTRSLAHRGPDDEGMWSDPASGIGLGHRRLSILDLSPSGCQPMHSSSGRYVIVFNGEIYNFREIRGELEVGGAPTVRWKGHSDTEVMLAAFEAWGVTGAVRRFAGMFAFALWDRQERCLHLVRDRIGEKPLYYGWMGNVFLFGSELKSLRSHPAWRGEIDRDALSLFFRYSYVPAPRTVYCGVRKLEPGTILTVRSGGSERSRHPRPEPYWTLADAVVRGRQEPFAGTEEDAAEALDALLRDAVARQMVADVPLGAFLSGGVDSSTIVAVMQAQSTRPVRTFTMGFHESVYNEADYASAVARHLHTDHTELYVTPQDALDVIPRLPDLYDEPFSDPSQIPTFLVSRLTRKHVTVSLSGDAGDELFGGYNRYFLGRSLWRKIGWMPHAMRSLLASGCTAVPPAWWDALASVLPARIGVRNAGDKASKLAGMLDCRTPDAMYRGLVSHWTGPDPIVRGAREPADLLGASLPVLPDFTQRMMYLDTMTYLPDDILVKVDRAAMGVGLETRVPFLDHRVVEFAWSLPLSCKIRGHVGKRLLRSVLYRYVPRTLIERPKTGFGVPLDAWLRGPLRDWAEHLLDEARLSAEGYLDPAQVAAAWREHLSGRRNRQYHLWDVLMFQAWLERSHAA